MYSKIATRNMRRSVRDYSIYFVTLVFGVCMFYAFNSITQQQTVMQMSEVQNRMLELLSILIGGVSIFIAVILGFLVVYANRYLIRRRKREFAIYLTLGMRRRDVSWIIVLETAIVGLLSLLIGLALGYLLSQALLYVTAALFNVKMDMFTFFFSPEAAYKTILCFALIFLISLVFNVISISRCKLIDLLNAERKSEQVTLRNLPLSIMLFIASIGLIIAAYYLLFENGLLMLDQEFAASTILVCIGTLLFFYSLSGIMLLAGRKRERFYLKNLNMFITRQLSSKANSAWISISLVCLTLFLALTSTCGGFSLVTVFNDSLERSTYYDASITMHYSNIDEPTKGESASVANGEGQTSDSTGSHQLTADPTEIEAAADDHDMQTALNRMVPNWSSLVETTAQMDYYRSPVTWSDLFAMTDYQLTGLLAQADADSIDLSMVKVSQLNELRALTGKEPILLGNDQFLVWCDFEELKGFWHAFLTQNDSIELFGTSLSPVGTELDTTLGQTATSTMDTGVLVVPDEVIPDNLQIDYSLLNVMFSGERADIDPLFNEAISSTFGDFSMRRDVSWPATYMVTAEGIYEQSTGLTAVISYLAIYIGVILLIACAAILALQQLTEAADNIRRYELLTQIGTDRKLLSNALVRQIGVYFMLPLTIALCHSIVATIVLQDVIHMFGHLDITWPLVITIALALVIYGGYFLMTCYSSRSLIFNQRR